MENKQVPKNLERFNKGKGHSNILNVGVGLGSSFLLAIVFGWLGQSNNVDDGGLSEAGAKIL
jgi:hypothetical protein